MSSRAELAREKRKIDCVAERRRVCRAVSDAILYVNIWRKAET